MDPLNTDEKLPAGTKPATRDMDSVMLGGCASFVVTSVGGYFLTIWPFLAFPHSEFLKTVLFSAAIGMGPAFLFSVIATRKTGLAGACGSVAGAMTTAVFLVLRLSQLFLAASAGQSRPPNYPEWFKTALPVCWVVLVLAICVLVLPKSEFQSEK